jgi:lysine-specific demethylase 8
VPRCAVEAEGSARDLTAAAFGPSGDNLLEALNASQVFSDADALGAGAVLAVLRCGASAFDRCEWTRCDGASRHVIDLAGQKLYETHWAAVPLFWRQLYWWCSAMRAVALVAANVDAAIEALAAVDRGMLLGAPCAGVDLASLASALQRLVPDAASPSAPPSPISAAAQLAQQHAKRRRLHAPPTCCLTAAVPRVQCPSVMTFVERWAMSQEPVVITDAIGHWSALRKWSDPNYLVSVAGKRLVPVETGGRYTADEWRQELMTLRDMVARFGPNPPDEDVDGCEGVEAAVYLAQHDLFSQIPELADDISVPDYCCCVGSGDPPEVNAWFGPAGTVSPLHFDRYHNLLCQVVGRKRVLMFAPSDSHRLYAHTDPLLHNTSRVDAVEPDLEAFPLFAEATRFECVLLPGEMLYIPPRWWHHVTALSLSFSVSHWFGGDDE